MAFFSTSKRTSSPLIPTDSCREHLSADTDAVMTTMHAETNWADLGTQITAARNDAYGAIADNDDGFPETMERIEQSPLLPTKVKNTYTVFPEYTYLCVCHVSGQAMSS